jgi:hypothetical protein
VTNEAERLRYNPLFLPWLKQATEDDVLEYSYELTTNIYATLAAEAGQMGIETVFVIVPYKLAVYGEIDPSFVEILEEEAPGVENAIPTLSNQEFERRMVGRGLPVLDLHPLFVDYIQGGGETPYWQGDSHWNEVGNRVAADMIGAWLIEQGFVPVNE